MAGGIRRTLIVALAVLMLGALISGVAFAADGDASSDGLENNRGVIDALVWDDSGNEDGIFNEDMLLVDGVKADLYFKDLSGNWVFLKSTVSGPGWYYPDGTYANPPFGWARGWLGFNELPLQQGQQQYVDYKILITAPSNYFVTGDSNPIYEGGAARYCRLSPPNLFAWFAHTREFYPEADNPAYRAFSVARYSSISGHVYNDLWPDGKHQFLEPGMWNVTVKLEGTNILGDKVSLQTATNLCGSYSFGKLRMGDYTITEVVPNLWTNTSASAVSLTLGSGQDATVDFNNRLMTLWEILKSRRSSWWRR